eukprot:scaffold194_cov142-Skeletonema_menzelii.AAC.2
MTPSNDTMHSVNSSHGPKISRSGRRNRSYSDAHVHFTTSQAASATDAFSNNKINGIAAYFDENPPEGVSEKPIISPAASSQHHYSGNRPRSKSESEPCHHRRISKKKYLHHQQRQHQHHHHLNYGRHSPPPLSSCGKMWVRPMPARRGGMETHHVITNSALGDRHISSLTFSGGSPQATSKVIPSVNEEAAITIDSSTTKPKIPSIDSYTGLEDDLMMKNTSSSPSPPTLFGSGYNTTSYSLLSHDSPTTPMAFGESGKPIVRVKNHHEEDDLFESRFLPVMSSDAKHF